MSQEGERRCRRSTPWATHVAGGSVDNASAMTRRLLTVVAVVMVVAAATAYAAVNPIPPDRYPPGCNPNGDALRGDEADDRMLGTLRRDLLLGGPGEDRLGGNWGADCLFGQLDEDRVVADGTTTRSGAAPVPISSGAAGARMWSTVAAVRTRSGGALRTTCLQAGAGLTTSRGERAATGSGTYGGTTESTAARGLDQRPQPHYT